MSSTKYSAELVPEPGLRRVVMLCGASAMAGGLLSIAVLPVAWHARVLLGLCWGLVSGRELWLIAKAHKRCAGLRLDADGQVLVRDGHGGGTAATIEPGSVVLQRLAWLRFRTVSGHRHAELLRRKSMKNNDWRRLQVIWRHLGAAG